MTQGGQRVTRKKEAPENPATELDLDGWLAQRGLVGDRRMKVGGKWFRFVQAATSEQLAAFGAARERGDLLGVMQALLVDPSELDELREALKTQRQPIHAEQEQQYLVAIVNFLVAGDAGESSAS
jgi:hypothetical protein